MDAVSNTIIAQLLFLELQDPKKDIYLYVNSPGGVVSSTLAIYDTMQHIKPDVATLCVGVAASGAAILLAGGAKGKRYALPNSEIMIHQVLGGTEGQASDIAIDAKHIVHVKEKISKILAHHTGQPLSQIERDSDRNFYMDADEAKKYGIIDEIVKSKNSFGKNSKNNSKK